MKRALKRTVDTYWYMEAGVKVQGAPPGLSGDLTGIYGDLTEVYGDLTEVYGDLTGVRGDLTGVRGDLTGVYGDIADCGLTEEDRERGVYISDLTD